MTLLHRLKRIHRGAGVIIHVWRPAGDAQLQPAALDVVRRRALEWWVEQEQDVTPPDDPDGVINVADIAAIADHF